MVQGTKLAPGEKKVLEYGHPYKVGAERVLYFKIFSCSLDDPPERDDDPHKRKPKPKIPS